MKERSLFPVIMYHSFQNNVGLKDVGNKSKMFLEFSLKIKEQRKTISLPNTEQEVGRNTYRTCVHFSLLNRFLLTCHVPWPRKHIKSQIIHVSNHAT